MSSISDCWAFYLVFSAPFVVEATGKPHESTGVSSESGAYVIIRFLGTVKARFYACAVDCSWPLWGRLCCLGICQVDWTVMLLVQALGQMTFSPVCLVAAGQHVRTQMGFQRCFFPSCKDVMNDWYCLIVSALSKNAVFVLLHRAYVPLYDSSPAPCATVPATGTAVATRNALLPLLLLAGE